MDETRGWEKELWGVVLTDERGAGRPMLIGSLWHAAELRRANYAGEPPRALLFTTRQEAREWCASKQAEYTSRPEGDPCRAWRFRPVRVRETVTVDRMNA